MRRTLQSVVLGQAWLLAVPALLPLSGLARLPWPGLLTLTLAAATLCLAGLRLLWLHRVGLTAERDAARARLKEREAQLVQSQKTEAVGRLACGIAHDFNNLLTAITGYTEMALLYPHLEKSVRGALEEIQSSAERAAGLTHRLLAFSRRQAVEPAALSLNVLIEDFRRMLRPIIGENIRLITELDPELGLLEADRGRMEQVLLNLVVNAREAMPDGGSLRIATRNAAAGRSPLGERPGVLLEIADSGLGMDAHTQSRMFEPFFTTKPDGTGLGLATVWEIVQGSGGHIAVESGPGRGTTFGLCFPRVHDAGRRDDPGGRGRGAGAADDRADPALLGLSGAGGPGRARGPAPARPWRPGTPRPDPHRRDHAGHERRPAGRTPAGGPSRGARAVHVGVHGTPAPGAGRAPAQALLPTGPVPAHSRAPAAGPGGAGVGIA
jgi:signal transduction histidine kinase